MFGDTEDAHTLPVAARKAGIADAVEERFYHGSITEGRSLFYRQQTVAMAVEAGMPKADAEAALENDDFRATVSYDEAHAQSIGLSGVPVFVMNEKYAISGAQAADNFLNALRQVWDDRKPNFQPLRVRPAERMAAVFNPSTAGSFTLPATSYPPVIESENEHFFQR